MPCGVGGVPTGAGLVDGGVDQGPWLQERVGDDSSKEGGGFVAKRSKSRKGSGKVGLAVGGGARASVAGG